jgi:formylglycine-generating enzyme required for sulfatase activity/serine/threonine protein kinase
LNDQSRSTEPSDPEVAAAVREYLERVDRGEPVDREEFLARHALIADQLRSFIAAEDEVRKLAGAETPLDRSQDSTKSFVGHGQETIAPQSAAKQKADSGGSGLSGQFGRYRIIRALGKGAMGTVYLAEDTHIERQVALKTPHFTEDPTGEQRERFFREARAAGNLRHPHICPIYDFGQIDGRHFITMAYIEGRPLSAFIQPDNQQAERQILLLVRKLALALQEAHDHGVVHRDLKPANIMVDKKGEPIIMDFGLAQQTRPNEDVRLTQTGNILGTPAYMSPEQIEGEPDKIGPPTDQYSLGVILFELLTGQLPFRGSVIAVMGQILTKEVTPPSQLRPDLDRRIESVCLKMMAKTPQGRFRSLKATADEISSILKSPAAKAASNEKPASSPTSSPPGDRTRADAGASQVRKSLKPNAVTESDLASLEELARRCYSRRDFEQVIQIVERIPEEKRSAGLAALLEKARGKADEISFLICDVDEADRLNDPRRALKKAEELLAIKPGHHRALEVQEKYSGYGEGGAVRIGPRWQFAQPWNEGGWIPWSVLAFGLAVFGVMTGVIVIYLNRTAVVIDIQNPGVEVAVKGTTVTVTGPGQQSVKVEPGQQELTITSAGLEIATTRFSLKKGDKKTVTVSIVNKEIVARLERELLPMVASDAGKERQQAGTVFPNSPQSKQAITNRTTSVTADPDRRDAGRFTGARGQIRKDNRLNMPLVWIPPGDFTMGSPKDEKDRHDDENQVQAKLTQGFWLGQHEVTQAEWQRVMQTTPWSGRNYVKEGDNYPATYVSWEDATKFCEKLTESEHSAGRLPSDWEYMLPTEAQWECACRGGAKSRFSFGDDESDLGEYAWFGKNTWDIGGKYAPVVGQKKANPLGLYDMHGNVWEWCRDRYAKELVGGTDPQGPSEGSSRVLRGGSWRDPAGGCRSASRGFTPELQHSYVGFRLAAVPFGK